jgi:hypothetical protein
MSSAQRIVRLERFFSTLQGTFDEEPRLRLDNFLKAWRGLPKPVRRSDPRTIDVARLEQTLSGIGEPLAAARADGNRLNPWVLAGLKRSEVRNAAVLASLWRSELSGMAASRFLNAFLRQVERRSGIPLPSEAQLKSGYRVRTEHCLAGERSERIDLTVEGRDFIIGFEIKIDAAEGEAQLQRYADALAERSNVRRSSAFLIFLAPFPHRGLVANSELVPIADANWHDLKCAADEISAAGGYYHFANDLVGSFAEHATTF